uniref:Uncharacterized protein n=1 Tax=viral metagenome TaxID=1070528 RepID=A0A6C0HW91_9ZZZZ
MDLDLSTLINNALIYYDKQNIEYDEYIKSNNITVERETNKIIFNDNSKELKYEFLGIFDNTTNIWIWAWLVPEFMFNETNISRKLLNYGLKISPTPINKLDNEQLYLKTQMVNSRFLLYDQFQLDLHLAISSYLAKDSFKFIYSKRKYLNKEKSKYITVYYLIF